MDEKYDTALLGILQHEGKIEKFLNVVFGFLYRRTDFYRHMKSKDDRLGFPPGVALKMLTSIFQQYDALTRQDDLVRDELEQERQQKSPQPERLKHTVPVTASCQPQKTSDSDKNTSIPTTMVDSAVSDRQSSSHTANLANDLNEGASGKGGSKINEDHKEQSAKSDNKELSEKSDTRQSDSKTNEAVKEKKKTKGQNAEEEDEDPELTKQQMEFQENPESYNGAVRENYSWSQSITDLDVRVKVPSYIKKGKDVKVDIGKKHLKVDHKNETGQWNTVVDGDLSWEVHKDDSMWTLHPGENVHINFEKKQERWWEAVFTDEPKINVRKIDASRPMSDLDDEAQAKIEEMMYNDRRKKMGLPTSQEEKMQDMLKNAWDAEGSPFKGQPFDPSRFSMDPSGVVNMKPL